jgi:nucleoside-diphosphate-sugar epimerase
MRAFVTGGTGLIGRHVIEALLAGGWEVWALVRDPERGRDLASRGVRIIAGDVTRPDFVHDLAGVDVLFHHAAWFEIGVRDYQAMYDVNVAGTANVLSLARQESVPRIVVTSTAGIFPSSPNHPATEASTPSVALDDPYVVTKLQAHELVVKAMRSGLPITIVAPSAVFGPRDTNQLGQSLALLVQGRLPMLPSGFGVNTWVHAADAAEGYVLAATVGRPGEFYLLGDRVLSMYGFLEAAAHAAGVKPPRPRVPMGLVRLVARFSEWRARRAGRTPLLSRVALDFSKLDVVVDASKARRELGWTPRPFEERVKETMAWYVETYARGAAPLPVKRAGASSATPARKA